MVRGGHLDVSILGAMDLVAGVRRMIVTMEHVSRDGAPKFVDHCVLPLTGANAVDVLITDLAVFERPDRPSAFRLVELAPDVTLEELRTKTTAAFGSA